MLWIVRRVMLLTAARLCVWAVALTGAAAALKATTAQRETVLPQPPKAQLEQSSAYHHPLWVDDSLVAVIVDRDVFQPTRSPAPAIDAAAPAPPPPVPAPAPRDLQLVGIVLGSPPMAVVTGLVQGGAARVVREGELLGGLRVRRITNDRVEMVGIDTLWVLRLEEPWR